MTGFVWGQTSYQGADHQDEDQDERPLSTYAFMIYSAGPEGEAMDGADTEDEAHQIISEMIQDPTVTGWVLYKRMRVSTTVESQTASSAADPQS